MTTYRPIDSKREEFRKYLERAGVMDALTKALVSLYEEAEKPEDALDYVRKNLGDNRPDMAEYEAVLAELEETKQRVAELEEINAALKARLPPEEGEEEEVPVEGEPAEGEEAPPPEGEEPQEPPPEEQPAEES